MTTRWTCPGCGDDVGVMLGQPIATTSGRPAGDARPEAGDRLMCTCGTLLVFEALSLRVATGGERVRFLIETGL